MEGESLTRKALGLVEPHVERGTLAEALQGAVAAADAVGAVHVVLTGRTQRLGLAAGGGRGDGVTACYHHLRGRGRRRRWELEIK